MAKQASKLKGYNNIFATRLRDLMETNKITQDMLAERASCSRQSISQYMDGSSAPNVDKLLSIANYFEVSVDYLLGREAYPTNNKDLQFVCEYTGLEPNCVENLHNSFTRLINGGVNFLISEDVNDIFFKMCYKLERLQRAYKYLIEHKKQLIESKEDIEKDNINADFILEEATKLNNNRDLILFNLQKIMDEFIRLYCKEEIKEEEKLNKEYQRLYEYMLYGEAIAFEECRPLPPDETDELKEGEKYGNNSEKE